MSRTVALTFHWTYTIAQMIKYHSFRNKLVLTRPKVDTDRHFFFETTIECVPTKKYRRYTSKPSSYLFKIGFDLRIYFQIIDRLIIFIKFQKI